MISARESNTNKRKETSRKRGPQKEQRIGNESDRFVWDQEFWKRKCTNVLDSAANWYV